MYGDNSNSIVLEAIFTFAPSLNMVVTPFDRINSLNPAAKPAPSAFEPVIKLVQKMIRVFVGRNRKKPFDVNLFHVRCPPEAPLFATPFAVFRPRKGR